MKLQEFKLIIAGGRDLIVSSNMIDYYMNHKNISNVTEVVSGGARGIDGCGELWAIKNEIKVTRFKAQWDLLGRYAGLHRNKRMAEYADALLLIWNRQSRGSANMKKEMIKLNKPVFEIIVGKDTRKIGEV